MCLLDIESQLKDIVSKQLQQAGFIDIEKAAEILWMDIDFVKKLIKAKQIPYHTLDSKIVFIEKELRLWFFKDEFIDYDNPPSCMRPPLSYSENNNNMENNSYD
jgi:hypothetical protein